MTIKSASRISDTEIEQAQAVSVAKIADARGLALKKVGGELIGPCPRCGGRDRFGINIVGNLFNCRGCNGRGGGAVSFTMWLDGVGFREAVEVLVGEPVRTNVDNENSVNSDRRQPNFVSNRDDAHEVRRQRAAWLWSHRQPITGTIAEKYLREVRGIACPLPPSLAFLPPTKPEHHPAMIAAFGLCDEVAGSLPDNIRKGTVVAVHLTLLKPDGSGKADVKPNKLMIGSPRGTPIVIAPPNDVAFPGLAITEGIEDALSVHQATGLGAWAAGSAPHMAKLTREDDGRETSLADAVPSWIDAVTIFADADADHQGERNATLLAARLNARGIEATIEGLAS